MEAIHKDQLQADVISLFLLARSEETEEIETEGLEKNKTYYGNMCLLRK